MGIGSRVFTTGWEWDGKVGSHLVDGTGRDYTICLWYETGRDRGTGREYSREIGREHSREIGREHSRETLSGMVGNTMGNWGWRHRLEKREMLPSPIYNLVYMYI